MMMGGLVAGRMHRTRRTSVDLLQAEICRGSEQMRQQAQTCGISGGSDTANMSKLSITRQTSLRTPLQIIATGTSFCSTQTGEKLHLLCREKSCKKMHIF